MEYNKLVRDKVPEIARQKGQAPSAHTAGDAEYEEKLLEKLAEEVTEFITNKDAKELADILEVLYAILELKKIDMTEITKMRRKKRAERGGFGKRVILEKIE